jgi:8-oxo-dGTP diphosphatase
MELHLPQALRVPRPTATATNPRNYSALRVVAGMRAAMALALLGKMQGGVQVVESARCVRLVSAVVERHGRYLITQSPGLAALPGQWAFPTGQAATEECPVAALQRELLESLGVEISVSRLRARRTHFYVGHWLERVLYDAQIPAAQDPRPLRVAGLRWVTAEDLANYPFAPAEQATADSILGLEQGTAAGSAKLAPADTHRRRPS